MVYNRLCLYIFLLAGIVFVPKVKTRLFSLEILECLCVERWCIAGFFFYKGTEIIDTVKTTHV